MAKTFKKLRYGASLCLVPQYIHSWPQESLIWACALLWAPGPLCLKTLSPDYWATHTQEAQRPPNSQIFQEQLSPIIPLGRLLRG